MEPLEATPIPALGVLVGINSANSWQAGTSSAPVLMSYVATNSTQRLSFVSLQTAVRPREVIGLASRPSNFEDMPYGVVIEVYLAKPLNASDTVLVSLAHSGATTYYPPQPIDDGK